MSMIVKGSVSRITRNLGDGSDEVIQLMRGGEQAVSDAHARYQEMSIRGSTFLLSVGAAAASLYAGGAAGTPLLALHNPTGSGKLLVLTGGAFGVRTSSSGAGIVTFSLWGGSSVQPTGTETAPRNILSMATTGSAAKGFSNTALTGSTALNLLMPLNTYYWATGASAFHAPGWTDLGGLIVVAPGNQIAVGVTTVLTSAAYDASIVWEEVPFG